MRYKKMIVDPEGQILKTYILGKPEGRKKMEPKSYNEMWTDLKKHNTSLLQLGKHLALPGESLTSVSNEVHLAVAKVRAANPLLTYHESLRLALDADPDLKNRYHKALRQPEA